MTKVYKYRLSFLYFLLGLGALYVSYIIFRATGYGGFSLLVVFYSLFTFLSGLGLLIKFIQRISFRTIVIGEDFIKVPGRWSHGTPINFRDLDDLNEIENNVIELSARGKVYLIRGNRMGEKDFQELRVSLINRIKQSTASKIQPS